MKPTIRDGNLFASNCDIICHQVNCQGIMGGGIALQIRNMCPDIYEKYREHCLNYRRDPSKLLGSALIVPVKLPGHSKTKYIANLFGQDDYGRNACYTNYTAVKHSFMQVILDSQRLGMHSIGIPYGIGCGLAGGDWTKMSKLIEETFNDTGLEVELWRLQI